MGMKLWAYMCTKMIDKVLDGRTKFNHKAIEKRIKRLIVYLAIKTYAKI